MHENVQLDHFVRIFVPTGVFFARACATEQTFLHFVQTLMRSAQSSRQALHIRALLSRSSGEMKFGSSSRMLKPVYFAFVKTMLEFFSQTTHFVKPRAHSPRPTSKIIAMIALRRAILMKANPVVSLHVHRLFRGCACSCKKDPCYSFLPSQTCPQIETIVNVVSRCSWEKK